MKTSDTLWLEEMHADTSSSAFNSYYLKPMSGRDEMVNKYKLFDEKTYNDLYRWFGSQVLLYEDFWLKRQRNVSYNAIVNKLFVM